MCMGFLPVFMSVHQMHAVSVEARRLQDPLGQELQVVMSHRVSLSIRETTELSL